jgi:hypothetical protein
MHVDSQISGRETTHAQHHKQARITQMFGPACDDGIVILISRPTSLLRWNVLGVSANWDR